MGGCRLNIGGGKKLVGSALAGDVLLGKTFSNVFDTGIEGTLELTGDAVASYVLNGKYFYSNDAKTRLTGTMYNNGAGGTITPSTTNQILNAGYWASLNTVQGDPNLISAYILGTKSIFGVAGKASVVDTENGDALAGEIISGKKAYVNGSLVTGTIVNNGDGSAITPGTSNQSINSGFWNTANTVLGDTDLLAENILSGKTIFGVAGSLVQGNKSASGTVTGEKFTITGLDFTPNQVFAFHYQSNSDTNATSWKRSYDAGNTYHTGSYLNGKFSLSVQGQYFNYGTFRMVVYGSSGHTVHWFASE